jgi:very-short-patch-repair endonuclease
MTAVYNKTGMKSRRRTLRRTQTSQEKIFWDFIRTRPFGEAKFRRQFGVSGFVLDFYCPKLKLAIEIDGSVHEQQVKYDRFRQSGIESVGIRFLRFTNDQIEKDFNAVIRQVHRAIAGK